MLPDWEQEAGRPFLVYGESMLLALMATVSATDQENKRKPPRAGSVPPRSTTPNSNSYAPTKSGVVTPAVRPAGSSVHSAPNKRMKMSDSTSDIGKGRAPLSMSRSHNGRAVSPSKIPGHGRSVSHSSVTGSALPRPIAMPVPKPGTQHHALGHGRLPSSGVLRGYGGRSVSSSAVFGGGASVAKKASRARKESFKPRSSIDAAEANMNLAASLNMGASARWAGIAGSVREEDEY